MLTHTFAKCKCVYLIEGAHVHICQMQMCLPASEGAHAHICQMQMCLPTPEGANCTHLPKANVFTCTWRCSRTHLPKANVYLYILIKLKDHDSLIFYSIFITILVVLHSYSICLILKDIIHNP